jgi:peptidoglycan/LPS O-acetylase OafA/YrhL
MGTASDWMSAVFWGIFWAGGMLLFEVQSRRTRHIKPLLSLVDVLAGVFLGLCFGLGITFRWKAFHWPLILFIVVTFVVGAVFARLRTH